ncbi:hypothetical protein [Thiohalomonas denitrificans]|uniref:hypothetical protein n=1 Tax=Thiohalomonas denitrificans TaxID=415747 RepID=UPI0026F12747|nr:hypothetical protein [Thiohalomonas denitrificans]
MSSNRWRALAVSFLIVAMVSAAGAKEVVVRLPPESLANWYKPDNERQVWLHTMFGLREAVQAVEHYTASGDQERAIRWSERLRDLYTKIPQMVPEWRVEVEPETMERLVIAVRTGDKPETGAALRRLDTTCDGCHSDYQATAAALYRSPAYSEVLVTDGQNGSATYPEAMREISRSLNHVKIALKDGFPRQAQSAVATLRSELDRLSGSCASCHRDSAPRERIFGGMPDLLNNLHTELEGADRSAQGRLLGELGVTVCARCHSLHRTLGDLRDEIER